VALMSARRAEAPTFVTPVAEVSWAGPKAPPANLIEPDGTPEVLLDVPQRMLTQ